MFLEFGNGVTEEFSSVDLPLVDSLAYRALKKFIEIGNLMTADPNFPSSLTAKVENYILNPSLAYSSDFGHDIFREFDFSKSFIAMIAG